MSRLALKPPVVAVRNTVLLAAGAAGIWAMAGFLQKFGTMDPFAALRPQKPNPEFDSFAGLMLKDVEMKHYKGDKLTTSAKVKEIEIRRDRRYFDLKGITNGLYQSDQGPMKFAAANGTWNQYRGLLTMNNEVRVASASQDFDIQTSMATFDSKTRKVS
ncbi:MAG TPA: LPS export ABC transporter periplasmic protein LptC, partial [Fimbriimonas sp.]